MELWRFHSSSSGKGGVNMAYFLPSASLLPQLRIDNHILSVYKFIYLPDSN